MNDKMILVPRAELLAWAKAWLEDYGPNDGTDCVTPFDLYLMKAPAEGRWQAHLEHAASMVKSGGRLVAILPESARRKKLLPGWETSWGEVHKFPGTSMSVSVLTGVKA